MSVLFHTETYDFILDNKEAEGRTGARILRISGEGGEETVLFDYLWPAQLSKPGMSCSEKMVSCAGNSMSLPTM